MEDLILCQGLAELMRTFVYFALDALDEMKAYVHFSPLQNPNPK